MVFCDTSPIFMSNSIDLHGVRRSSISISLLPPFGISALALCTLEVTHWTSSFLRLGPNPDRPPEARSERDEAKRGVDWTGDPLVDGWILLVYVSGRWISLRRG